MAKIPVADRFVRATHDDWGVRQGPELGFVIHMAEGNNVWRYLSGSNVLRNVSVHFTIEADGEIVQMLDLNRISGSINPGTIRTDNDENGHFGVSHNRAVLGEWWRNPNHCVITVEVAGFSKDGPNDKQVASIDKLFTWLRGKYPRIKPLGHRDFQNVKPCPGQKMWFRAYPAIGGHGKDFKASEMDGQPDTTSKGRDSMLIAADDVIRQSSHFIEIPAGTEIFNAPGGEVIRTVREKKRFDYFGWTGSFRSIEIQAPPESTADPENKRVIAYVEKNDAQVIGTYPPAPGPVEPEPPQPSDREKRLESALQEVRTTAVAITADSTTIVATVDESLA